jgi:HlyD family secretion protein
MVPTKIVSLKARPWKSSQLSFEIGGVVGEINTQLGAAVTPFDFATFYASLNPSIAGDLPTLSNSQSLLSAPAVSASSLATVRAEPRKAALDTAVNSRQNAYFAKYSPTVIPDIVNNATKYYSAPGSAANPTNPWMLAQLQTLSGVQADQLTSAYNADGRGWPGYASGTGVPAVVQQTFSLLTAKTYTIDGATVTPNLSTTTTPHLTTTTSGQGSQTEMSASGSGSVGIGPGTSMGAPDPTPLNDGASWSFGKGDAEQESASESANFETATQTGRSVSNETGSESSTGNAYAYETEQISNKDYTFRVPFVEAQAQNLRAQVSLNNEQFALFMSTQNLPNLGSVLQNELNSIDLWVYQLQVALLSTVLLSPIAGTVTGVYKNPGEPVRPGEPVVRIEDNSTLLLVARLVYAGPIRVATGATPASVVTISTTLFDAAPLTPALVGSVVAVRGAGDDDLWDVVVQCANPLDASGNPVFPIGYNFDYDNTTVTIT